MALVALVSAAALGRAAVDPQAGAGNLWVGSSSGLLNVSTHSGQVQFEISHALGISTLAVNDVDGQLWAYGNKRLFLYSRKGVALMDADVPPSTHGGDPVGMQVDGMSGNLWLAIKRDLYRYDQQGGLQQTLTLPGEIVALALDRSRSRLWVATASQLLTYDAEGVLVRSLDVGKHAIYGLAFDRSRNWLWLNMAGGLRRYDDSGTQTFEVAGDYAGVSVSDGAGGLWLARDGTLLHLDETGAQNQRLEPFAGGLDKAIVDVASDPQDASVWVASSRQVRHYAVDGELLGEILSRAGDGVVRRLFRTRLYADLDPPELAITAPADGSVLRFNRPDFVLRYFDLGLGVDSGSIVLSTNGQPLPVLCEAGPADARCTPQDVLPEGGQNIRARIADRAGNIAAAEIHLVVDTVPPAALAGSAVLASDKQDGTFSVTGSAGSAEPGASVRITNLRTGEVWLGVVAPDGSFHIGVEAQAGDELSILLVDVAGNASAATLVQTASPLSLAVSNPQDGSTVYGTIAYVSGELEAPPNTGILVNDIPALVMAHGSGYRFYAPVPLASSVNVITVQATLQDGRTLSRGITVHRSFSGAPRPEVVVLPRSAEPSQQFLFEVRAGGSGITIDFDGDGKTDYTRSGSTAFAQHTYNRPGYYLARVTAKNFAGQLQTIEVPVFVIDPNHQDQLLRGVWAGLIAALAAGDTERALTALTATSRREYRGIFEALRIQMPEILGRLTDIEPLMPGYSFSEYAVMKVDGDKTAVHIITFMQGTDGVWRIDSM